MNSSFGRTFLFLTDLAWKSRITLPVLITAGFMILNFRWEVEINIHTERITIPQGPGDDGQGGGDGEGGGGGRGAAGVAVDYSLEESWVSSDSGEDDDEDDDDDEEDDDDEYDDEDDSDDDYDSDDERREFAIRRIAMVSF